MVNEILLGVFIRLGIFIGLGAMWWAGSTREDEIGEQMKIAAFAVAFFFAGLTLISMVTGGWLWS